MIDVIVLSKEVWKSNFRQYGEMKKQSAGRRVRREKIRRKKMQVREKVFFRGFVAPEGWKVGSLKRHVRRHLEGWEMKSCTPLWREAHLEVKCVKNWGVRTTFGSWDVEKVHAVVARSRFPSQVKMYKTPHVRANFGGSDLEKVHAVVARSTFRSQNVQNTRGSDHFWRFRCCFASLRVITLHYTLHYTTVHYTTLHNTTTTTRELHNYTPLH